MIQATDGNFYGVTISGGAIDSTGCTGGCGTVFKITPDGVLTTLHKFCEETSCPDGNDPAASLTQASDGNLYGTTFMGGNGEGTLFRITTSGEFTTLYTFCSLTYCEDGASPRAPLVQASDGTLYGTTSSFYNNYGFGTVFSFDLGLPARE